MRLLNKVTAVILGMGMILVPVSLIPKQSTINMTAFAKEEVIASGTCGENLTWMIDKSGTLTISGTGDMENYSYNADAKSFNTPWFSIREDIRTLIIEDGVTGIGDYAFFDCRSLDYVRQGRYSSGLPNSITKIGKCAFGYCTNLWGVSLPENISSISYGLFYGCTKFKNLSIHLTQLLVTSDLKRQIGVFTAASARRSKRVS